jgi:hypothetical protein
LWFDFNAGDILPDFDNAKVYIYDLSTNEEAVSGMIDYQISNYQYTGSDEIRYTGILDLDPSDLVTNHAYYLRIDQTEANGSNINNIACIFAYDTGRSIDVRTQNVVKDTDYSDQNMINEDAVTADNNGNESKEPVIADIPANQIAYEIEGNHEYSDLSQEEYQLTKELFNFDYNQTEIYSPFYCVSCMQEFNGRPESFTLWYDFSSNDILPNFDNAQVLLYDLTAKEEAVSKVSDYRIDYVSRDRDESDRRIVVINLTDKGKDAVSALNRSVNNYYKKILLQA